jgi:hypothetical protein
MKHKTKIMGTISMILLCLLVHPSANAQIPVVSLVSSAIKKVITALDLEVQKLQNQTIALQNAEAQLENKMSLGNLNNISSTLNKEKNLYSSYYQELQQVKKVITDYDEVKQATQQQIELVSEYKTAYNLFQQDKNFSPPEIKYMASVYDGILQESIRNLNEVVTAVTSLTTQMSDAERLLMVHKATTGMQKNLNDVRQFNNNNMSITMQRAQQQNDMNQVRQLYGISN